MTPDNRRWFIAHTAAIIAATACGEPGNPSVDLPPKLVEDFKKGVVEKFATWYTFTPTSLPYLVGSNLSDQERPQAPDVAKIVVNPEMFGTTVRVFVATEYPFNDFRTVDGRVKRGYITLSDGTPLDRRSMEGFGVKEWKTRVGKMGYVVEVPVSKPQADMLKAGTFVVYIADQPKYGNAQSGRFDDLKPAAKLQISPINSS